MESRTARIPDVWADSAYRSDEIEEKLAERGLKSRIHRRAYRNRKLSEAQKAANTTRSKVRARVEHEGAAIIAELAAMANGAGCR